MNEKGSFGVDLTLLAPGSAFFGFIGFRHVNLKLAGGGIIMAVSWTGRIFGANLLTGPGLSIFWLVAPVDGGWFWMGFYFTVGDYSSGGGGGIDGLRVVFCCKFMCISVVVLVFSNCRMYVGNGSLWDSSELLVSTSTVDWCLYFLSFKGIRDMTDCILFIILPRQVLPGETDLGLLGVLSKSLFLCFVSMLVVLVVSSNRLVEVRCLSGVFQAFVRL